MKKLTKKIAFACSLAIILAMASCSFDEKVPPLVSIKSPEQDSTVTSPFIMRGTASDENTLVKVQIRVDQGEFVDVDGKETWSAIVSLTGTGKHVITAKAVDYAGNEGFVHLTVTQ